MEIKPVKVFSLLQMEKNMKVILLIARELVLEF